MSYPAMLVLQSSHVSEKSLWQNGYSKYATRLGLTDGIDILLAGNHLPFGYRLSRLGKSESYSIVETPIIRSAEADGLQESYSAKPTRSDSRPGKERSLRLGLAAR